MKITSSRPTKGNFVSVFTVDGEMLSNRYKWKRGMLFRYNVKLDKWTRHDSMEENPICADNKLYIKL